MRGLSPPPPTHTLALVFWPLPSFAAADVLQTAHIMLSCPEIALSGCVDALDELVVLVAAIVHDFKVPASVRKCHPVVLLCE